MTHNDAPHLNNPHTTAELPVDPNQLTFDDVPQVEAMPTHPAYEVTQNSQPMSESHVPLTPDANKLVATPKLRLEGDLNAPDVLVPGKASAQEHWVRKLKNDKLTLTPSQIAQLHPSARRAYEDRVTAYGAVQAAQLPTQVSPPRPTSESISGQLDPVDLPPSRPARQARTTVVVHGDIFDEDEPTQSIPHPRSRQQLPPQQSVDGTATSPADTRITAPHTVSSQPSTRRPDAATPKEQQELLDETQMQLAIEVIRASRTNNAEAFDGYQKELVERLKLAGYEGQAGFDALMQLYSRARQIIDADTPTPPIGFRSPVAGSSPTGQPPAAHAIPAEAIPSHPSAFSPEQRQYLKNAKRALNDAVGNVFKLSLDQKQAWLDYATEQARILSSAGYDKSAEAFWEDFDTIFSTLSPRQQKKYKKSSSFEFVTPEAEPELTNADMGIDASGNGEIAKLAGEGRRPAEEIPAGKTLKDLRHERRQLGWKRFVPIISTNAKDERRKLNNQISAIKEFERGAGYERKLDRLAPEPLNRGVSREITSLLEQTRGIKYNGTQPVQGPNLYEHPGVQPELKAEARWLDSVLSDQLKPEPLNGAQDPYVLFAKPKYDSQGRQIQPAGPVERLRQLQAEATRQANAYNQYIDAQRRQAQINRPQQPQGPGVRPSGAAPTGRGPVPTRPGGPQQRPIQGQPVVSSR